MNPVSNSDGLALNISKTDNSLDLDLALEVAPFFRIKEKRAKAIVKEVSSVVKEWRLHAKKMKLPSDEIEKMAPAFRFAEKVT